MRKGTQDEHGVPGPLPALRPHPAPNFALKSTDPELLKVLLPTLAGECDVPLADGVASADVSIHRVS